MRFAREQGERGEGGGQRRGQPEDGLAVGGEVERDAAHRRDRQPEKEPPPFGLLLDRGSEAREKRRGKRRGAANSGHGAREDAGAGGGGHDARVCGKLEEGKGAASREVGKPRRGGANTGRRSRSFKKLGDVAK